MNKYKEYLMNLTKRLAGRLNNFFRIFTQLTAMRCKSGFGFIRLRFCVFWKRRKIKAKAIAEICDAGRFRSERSD